MEIKEKERGNEHLLSTMCPECYRCAHEVPKFYLWSLPWIVQGMWPEALSHTSFSFLHNSNTCQKMYPSSFNLTLVTLTPDLSSRHFSPLFLPSIVLCSLLRHSKCVQRSFSFSQKDNYQLVLLLMIKPLKWLVNNTTQIQCQDCIQTIPHIVLILETMN